MNVYDSMKEYIYQALQEGIPVFCFDPDFVNLKIAYE